MSISATLVSDDRPVPLAGSGRAVNERQVSYLRDLKLAVRARQDPASFEKLCTRFRPVIESIVSKYFLPGGDKDDLYQEAMFGLYKAIQDYDGRSSSLDNFVRLCMVRQVITAVRAAARNKHRLLNGAVSFSQSLGEGGETLGDRIHDSAPSLVERLEQKERLELLVLTITSNMTELESGAIRLHAARYSQAEIARYLSVTAKAVDNALQRARRKFEEAEIAHVAFGGRVLERGNAQPAEVITLPARGEAKSSSMSPSSSGASQSAEDDLLGRIVAEIKLHLEGLRPSVEEFHILTNVLHALGD